MSGQWEVVGRKKDKNSKLPVQAVTNIKDGKRNNHPKAPKVEDVCKCSNN